nr:uncharacterized protein LOC104105413 [Nicotiana tomentosiformis]
MASVDSTIAPSVVSAETSKKAWDYLHTTYANRSQTRIYRLRDALAKVQRDQKFVTDYLREIRIITDELAVVGARISNEELIVKILSGLGPEYKALSIVIRSRDLPISYEKFSHKLTDHELYLKQAEKKKSVTHMTVQVAQRTVNNNNNSNRQTRRWSGQPQWRPKTTPVGQQQWHSQNTQRNGNFSQQWHTSTPL